MRSLTLRQIWGLILLPGEKGRRESVKNIKDWGYIFIFQAPSSDSLLYEMAGVNVPVLLSLLVKKVDIVKWRESTLALRWEWIG